MTDSATKQSQHAYATHDHGWLTESSHQTSEGRVLYVRCTLCGVRRVDLQPHALLPPQPLSRARG
ncbi:hypothetical protein FB381_3322 [Nocardioides albertanoniae]|uniref:Uncharacterized protein n=1 Tax=Nocardioides albertanoniae TaxID=1175486 RepID=A0A543A9Y4_9ACTN|nr:hypothetical protein [Nocardioides albertanoniae]TQL69417.1 hypothetical protein FB381_3322 [Nocardioides albertanoniae]